jgi:hypothetical protein
MKSLAKFADDIFVISNKTDAAILDLRIYQKHRKEKDEFLGGMREDVSKLLAEQSKSLYAWFPVIGNGLAVLW